MMSDFAVVLVGSSELKETLSPNCRVIANVDSFKQLVRVLVDSPVDLIVFGHKTFDAKRFAKVFKTYHVPAIVQDEKTEASTGVLLCPTGQDVSHSIESNSRWILSERAFRDNQHSQYWLEKVIQFTNQVTHTSKELFISETKNYFRDELKAQRCHWVEVQEDTLRRPPILRLRHELSQQQVDQGTLIGILDQCEELVVETDDFQIWELPAGEFVALLWLQGPDAVDQCIVLNRFKLTNGFRTEKLFSHLMPFLKRRWSLCLTMSHAQEQVYRDSLTTLYNQRFLDEVLEKKIEENKRYNTPFSVLFIDVDHFKKVNDSMGHLVGSGVLKQLGDLLMEQIRNSDYAFRYGGDEFILLLSHTEGEESLLVAERIRKEVENKLFNVNNVDVRITISIGLAFYPEHAQSAEEIVRIADEAMYYGKNKSRNIVYKAS